MLIAQANHSSLQPRASNMPQNTKQFKQAKNPGEILAQMSMRDMAHVFGYVNEKHLSQFEKHEKEAHELWTQAQEMNRLGLPNKDVPIAAKTMSIKTYV